MVLKSVRESNAPVKHEERYYEQWRANYETPRRAGWAVPITDAQLSFAFVLGSPAEFVVRKYNAPAVCSEKPIVPFAFI